MKKPGMLCLWCFLIGPWASFVSHRLTYTPLTLWLALVHAPDVNTGLGKAERRLLASSLMHLHLPFCSQNLWTSKSLTLMGKIASYIVKKFLTLKKNGDRTFRLLPFPPKQPIISWNFLIRTNKMHTYQNRVGGNTKDKKWKWSSRCKDLCLVVFPHCILSAVFRLLLFYLLIFTKLQQNAENFINFI